MGKLSLKELYGDIGAEDESMDSLGKEFKGLDKDGDGLIDKIEMMPYESGHHWMENGIKQIFDIADADQDGHVTADELAVAQEKLEEEGLLYQLSELKDHFEL